MSIICGSFMFASLPFPGYCTSRKGFTSQTGEAVKNCWHQAHISQCEMAGHQNGPQGYRHVSETLASYARDITSEQKKAGRSESAHLEGAESAKGSIMSKSQRGGHGAKVVEEKDAVNPSHGSSPGAALAVQTLQDLVTSLSTEDRLDKVSPLFSFGVITDIQYADIPDGHSFLGTPRFYRHALDVLKRAVVSWNDIGRVAFAIHFGDLVDGFSEEEGHVAFSKVLAEFSAFDGGSVYHIIGNHCLYNLSRVELNKLFRIPLSSDEHSYYDFSPHPGFRFVVLDGYDISVLGWPKEHPNAEMAIRLLDRLNPNEEKNSPDGLIGDMARFVKFNGGLGIDQLKWLEHILQEAVVSNEKVIICCHLPLHPDSLLSFSPLCWNYTDVLDVLRKYSCVVACLSGHAHTGGYTVDSNGTHYVVLEAVLECPPGKDAFGIIDVFPDRLSLIGRGRLTSREMHFRKESLM